mgnify:CR=1 FL=1
MDTNQLKRFAQEARKKLINQISAKLELVLTSDSAELREKATQIKKLQEAINSTPKTQVIDKVAYTWFNRFMALRFMDANDYQPIGIRVVTPKKGYTLPELLDEAKQGNIPEELDVKRQHVYDVLDGKVKSTNAQNEAYKELLIGACNHLHKVFPFLFEKINDYTELLLPEDLTSEFSILQDIRDGMTTEDCEEVEIIGWLYQFYISEKKDEVFASKSKVKKEDIPAATQLFTPRWIVEYMVQNTVGKLWLQNNPSSKLRDHMPYFIESPSVTSDDYLKINSPEEITLLDQACGSGHILVYGFELLSKIYEEEGYNPSEIPQLIIEKNLFGFEIDERAAQLAGMAMLMKARSYHRRAFRKALQPNILCYQDVNIAEEDLNIIFKQLDIKLSDELKHDLKNIAQATNLGSLIIPHTDTRTLKTVLELVETELQQTTDIFLKSHLQQLQTALKQLVLLSVKYHCIVDNPPYMGSGNMNKSLGDFVRTNYPDSKADLMACFMEAGLKMLQPKGFLGMINQHSWMFLSSYEKLREKLIKTTFFDTLLHLGSRTFPEIGGEVVQNASFTFWNTEFEAKSNYLRLVDEGSTELKRIKAIEAIKSRKSEWCYIADQKDFKKIPGTPIGYWITRKVLKIFDKNSLSDETRPKMGMRTGNNEKFLRRWFEIINKEIGDEWVLYRKGGDYRKWFNVLEYVVLWENNGFEIKTETLAKYPQLSWENMSWKISNEKDFFKPGIEFSRIGAGNIGCRFFEENTIFDTAVCSLYDSEHLKIICAYINSKVATEALKVLSPTLTFQPSDVGKLPFDIIDDVQLVENIRRIVLINIKITKDYVQSTDLSLNFLRNELIKLQTDEIEECYNSYKQYWQNQFIQIHKNEEELNKQFINIYGLQEELTPDVPLEDITILKEETKIVNNQLVFQAKEVFAQLMSYAVGCMFGRYSLDRPGLILANQGETLEDYLNKLAASNQQLAASFIPDDDNIIPILDDEWFEDDIVGRFYEFLKVSFGTDNFDKNLAFVEECLGKDIRKYFVKDFYKDHIKRYKKRPIYWQFSSPKGSFNVLIYMHRYTPDTLNQILNGYLVEYREKLKVRMEHLDHLIETGSATEQTKAAKEKDKLKRVLLELQEYERDTLYPLATERIAIDLDDGVLVNYNKFGEAIKLVKGLNDKKAKDKVKKFDWIDIETIK